MKFNSRHLNTISFKEEDFVSLIGKEWETLECTMSDGDVIKLPRHIVTYLWATSKDWRGVPHSKVKIKVLKIR
jgi:hypothetical protein